MQERKVHLQMWKIINVEIHPQEDEDHVKRVRYYLGSIDMSFWEKGCLRKRSVYWQSVRRNLLKRCESRSAAEIAAGKKKIPA